MAQSHNQPSPKGAAAAAAKAAPTAAKASAKAPAAPAPVAAKSTPVAAKSTPVAAKSAPALPPVKSPEAPAAKAPAAKTLTPIERSKLINETAYFIAQKRGFSAGNPVQDWLSAEQQVDKTQGKRS
jgi:hypothetical protein